MKNKRTRDVKYVTHNHIANKWEIWDLDPEFGCIDPGEPVPKPMFITVTLENGTNFILGSK